MGGVLEFQKLGPVGLGELPGLVSHRGNHYRIIYTESGQVRTGGYAKGNPLMRYWIPVLLLLGAPAVVGQDDAAGAKLFEEKVGPILSARCFKCHGPEAPKPKAGLRLDSREAALKGGDSGPALVPGKPEQSALFKAVSGRDPDLQMPPKEKMPAGEIEVLRQWILLGAVVRQARPDPPAREEDHRRRP